MQRRSFVLCAILAGIAAPRAARAQACHPPALLPALVTGAEPDADPRVTAASPSDATGRRGFSVELTLEAATVELAGARGGWQGALLGVAWRSRRVALRGTAPLYRVDDGAASDAGLGDLLVEAQVTALARRGLAAGAGLALGLPTGDAAAGRGMGHPMVMPQAWGALHRGRVGVSASAWFGYAAGSDEHQVHHHGPTVTVSPMSPVEIGAAAWLGVAIDRAFTARIGALGAAPLADGSARASATIGLVWQRAAWQVAPELELPVRGAFDARVALQIVRAL